MKLPNRTQAYVPERKLTAYLLSLSHPVGGSKARFFRKIGFDESNVEHLQEELWMLAQRSAIDEVEETPHGTKYVITGLLHSPDGEAVTVRTVWMMERESDAPRFVTAYPA
jgi:hypothetical protein